MTIFPQLSDEQRVVMLQPRREGRVRVVIDTDMANEIDDQFALTWALMSQDVFTIEGVYAAPYSFQYRLDELRHCYQLVQSGEQPVGADVDLLARYIGQVKRLQDINVSPFDLTQPTPAEGMEESYQETLTIYEKLGIAPENVYRGSPQYLTSYDNPVPSPAADHLVELAKTASPEEPLYVLAIGCLTNIASAFLMSPEIIKNIVVVWTAGFPTTSPQINHSFNSEQDLLATQLLFDCGVPLVYLPGFHIGAQLRISLPEMEQWVRGKGTIGDYLYHLYTHNPIHPLLGIDDHFGRTWVIWDLINFAWLLDASWVPTDLGRAPKMGDDKRWYRNPGRHVIREAYAIDRDAIFRDFFTKLDQHAAQQA
jgi:purine nucleosidase